MYLVLEYLSSNQLGNVPAKTCQTVRKTYSTARQPISVLHFAYRPDSELNHTINIYTHICLPVFCNNK